MSQNLEVIAHDLPVEPLLRRLEAQPELWRQLTARQDTPGSPHRETECIVLRWPADQSVWASFYDLTCVDYPLAGTLMPEIGQLILVVLERLGLEAQHLDVGRALLVVLRPGGQVTPHVDEGPYADRYDRFHVVLQAEEYDVFTVAGEAHACAPGELFWFNHKRMHGAINLHTTIPRIHLILDVVAPQYRAKRGLTFQRERAIDLWDEITPLLVEHKAEIAHYDDIVLDPDMQAYEAVDAEGGMRAYTARINGTLVGYAVFFVRHNMHYRQSLQAVQDVLFVDAVHRHGRVGYQLIRYAEVQLRTEGVQVLYQHVKRATPQTIALFKKMDYEEVEAILAKRLDR